MTIIDGESELTQPEMQDEQVTLENGEFPWWHVTSVECRHAWQRWNAYYYNQINWIFLLFQYRKFWKKK